MRHTLKFNVFSILIDGRKRWWWGWLRNWRKFIIPREWWLMIRRRLQQHKHLNATYCPLSSACCLMTGVFISTTTMSLITTLHTCQHANHVNCSFLQSLASGLPLQLCTVPRAGRKTLDDSIFLALFAFNYVTNPAYGAALSRQLAGENIFFCFVR